MIEAHGSGLYIPSWYESATDTTAINSGAESYDEKAEQLTVLHRKANDIIEKDEDFDGPKKTKIIREIGLLATGLAEDSTSSIKAYYREMKWTYLSLDGHIPHSTKKILSLANFVTQFAPHHEDIETHDSNNVRDLGDTLDMLHEQMPKGLQQYIGGMNILFDYISPERLRTQNPNAIETLRQQTRSYLSGMLSKLPEKSDDKLLRDGKVLLKQIITEDRQVENRYEEDPFEKAILVVSRRGTKMSDELRNESRQLLSHTLGKLFDLPAETNDAN